MNIEIPASIHEVLGLGVGNGCGALEWTREASRGPHLDRGILLGRQADIGNRPVEMGPSWRGHFVRNRGSALYQPDDRAAHDPEWSASRATALQGRAPWVVKAAALESAAVRDEAQSRPAQAAT
jgi:hypothetical protein